MTCKFYLRLLLLFMSGILATPARGALYLIPEYSFDASRQDNHWCDFTPDAGGAYKEVAEAPALWCDGIFTLGNEGNPRNAEKAYRYQFRHSVADGETIHQGAFWEGPVVGYCFLPADRNVWYIHLNLNLEENETFSFRISAARSLSDTYHAAGYDVVAGDYGQNPDADRRILPFTRYDIRQGISLGDMGLEDAGGFTTKENIDKVPLFSVTGLKGLYTLCIDNTDPSAATLTLAPSLFATGSEGFAEATGSSYGHYGSDPTGNPTAEFLFDADGKYKLLLFLQNFSPETNKDWIGFNIAREINVTGQDGDQFWNSCLTFVGDGDKQEDFSIGKTYPAGENSVSGLQLQKTDGAFPVGYHTVELGLDPETHEVADITVREGNTLRNVRRGYQPPRIYVDDRIVTLDFNRAYNCWITEFTAPADGEMTYRRRPFWGGDADSENVVLSDTEHGSALIPGRTYQLIVDNATEDRTITCREMPVYITGYSKTFGENPDDATGWNSNTGGQFTQVANGIYYFPVMFKGSCEFGISRTRGRYWENFDDGRAYNETASTLKEDGKSRLMEVPFGEFRAYEGFGAPKGQNFNWKFNDELNSDQESWYIIVVDVNTRQVSVQRPGLTPVISDFRISPLEEDASWREQTEVFTVNNQPFGAVTDGTITDPVRYTRLNHISCRLSFTSEYQMPGVFESRFSSLSVNGREIGGVTTDGGVIDFVGYQPDDVYKFFIVTDLRFPKKDAEGNVIAGEFTTQQNNIELTRHLGQAFAAPSVTIGETYVVNRESHYDGQVEIGISVAPSRNDAGEILHVYPGFELGSRSHNDENTGASTRDYRGYILPWGADKETGVEPLSGYLAFDGNSYDGRHDWSDNVLSAGKMPLHIGYITGSINPYSAFTATVGAAFYAHYPVLASENGAEFTADDADSAASSRAAAAGRYIDRIDARTDGSVALSFPIRGILSSLDATVAPPTTASEYFDLGGRPVDGGSLRPGIYIRKTGDAVEKIIIP